MLRDRLLSFEVDVIPAALQALSGMDGHATLLKMLPDQPAQRRKAKLKAQGERVERDYLKHIQPWGVRETNQALRTES